MNSEPYEDFMNQDFTSFSDWLFSLNPYEFSIIASALGLFISSTLTVNQQNSLGNFLELLGQVILTVNAQATTLQQERSKKQNIKPCFETNSLEEEILKIKQELIQLRKDSFPDG
ncbi:MAG: hypothetical protein PHN72_02340 [Bacilli bacterium]|nr:hypothetical protein [Bacilli bacterium]